jgi:glycosyltransferase involved in cell wall biosynthesis
MRILIISDAWHPQVNGVVRTLEATIYELEDMGHTVLVIGPQRGARWSFPAPTYPDIILEFFAHRRIAASVQEFQPELIHIATEGPLGLAARQVCLEQRLPFTTSFHTRFPEYLAARVPRWLAGPVRLATYFVMRRFHAPSSAVMVATPSIEAALRNRRFRHLARWTRGVDTQTFQPYGKDLSAYADLPRPILLYVGRVAVEKNLPAFLALQTTGSKVVIGDGPDLPHFKAQYPEVHFLGKMAGETLGRYYAAADLFVFPSHTDTFGLVLFEACAAGLRIASYPAPGPIDIFCEPVTADFAILDKDLQRAVDRALALPDNPALPRAYAEQFSWRACTEQFFNNLQLPTPKAVKRITRFREWLKRWWRHFRPQKG